MCHGLNVLSPHAHARIKACRYIEGEGGPRSVAGIDRR
jgi:hypothetical protein